MRFMAWATISSRSATWMRSGRAIGEGLLFLPVKGACLERLEVFGGELAFGFQVIERLTEEARRAARAVVDAVANLRLHDLDDGADERARGVILAAVAPGIAHALDFLLVELGQLVLLGLGAEPQLVNVVDDLAQIVAAGNLVLN